jgi:hypothetical protein
MASLLGLLLAWAFIFGLQILSRPSCSGNRSGAIRRWCRLMVLGGVQLIAIGIMGEYIGKIPSK